MSNVYSAIAFADYIFPAGTSIKSIAMDSTIENAPMLGLDGEFAPAGYALGTVITLSIDMGGGGDYSPTTNLQMMTKDDVNNEANQLFKRLQEGYQQLTLGTSPARYVMAQKRKWTIEPLPGSGRTHFTMTLELYVQDPRWLSSTLNSSTFTANQQKSITNAGTARSYPVFTITNMTQTPQVGIGTVANAGNGVKITLNDTPLTSDTYVIDCDPRNRASAITKNGVVRLDLLGTTGIQNTIGTADMFPFLNPGTANVVWFGFGNDTQGTLTWRDAWGL